MTRIPVTFAMQPGLRDRLFTPAALDRLAEVACFDRDLVVHELPAPGVDPATLARTEVLITAWGAPVLDRAALALLPRLRAVVHAAGSVKHHLVPDFWLAGIPASSAADANALPVAEYTLAMILLANKAVLPLAAAYREEPSIDVLAGFPDIGNYHKRVGIIGASRIGRRVIELLRPFDLEVAVSDPYLTPGEAERLGVLRLELDELVRTSDVVSVHAPDLPETRHLMDARRLGLMRDGATLINTARGALVDQDALVAEVSTGRLNAVLDVTVPERLPIDSPLLGLPNVIVTPHMAGSLGTELRRMGDCAVDEVHRLAAGLGLRHPVLAEQLDRTA